MFRSSCLLLKRELGLLWDFVHLVSASHTQVRLPEELSTEGRHIRLTANGDTCAAEKNACLECPLRKTSAAEAADAFSMLVV